ncbi:penicillin-binding protein activator [Vibrio xiamenensis]|nr:penicillin-binding protein activator [Vibrio xiamenensis]
MKHHKRLSVPRILTPVALAITLAACSTGPSTPTSVDITLEPTQTAESYLMQADSSEGALQVDWLIMAYKASVEANDFTQADNLSRRLSRTQMTQRQQAQWQLIRAQQYINQGNDAQALSSLNFDSNWSLENAQWQEYYQLRATLYAKSENYFEVARQLSGLQTFAPVAERQSLSENIWKNLNQYDETQLSSLRSNSDDAVFDGWVQLAMYNKSLASDIPQLRNSFKNWLDENPQHPAALYTPKSIDEILQLKIVKPVNTALLLPLSGKFAPQAKLIRDGFVLEMMNDHDRDENATLTVIDTNASTAQDIENTILEKNIDFIVGPLIKENVEKLQAAQSHFSTPIPTLALNIPEELEAGINTCYLALSPEQEVAQAAIHLYDKGYRYPLILAPNGHLGNRVVEAFEKEWKEHSDNKVAVSLFGDKRQLQRNINNIFGLQDSQQHIAQMQSLLNIPLETQPRSRRDIDSVYIVANSAELTLIKPFIEVAINPDTKPPKLFSNSRSNTGQTQYEDLSGVAYSDLPILINPDPELAAQMKELWPKDSNAEKRLQALGMDAYRLMDELPQMKVVAGYTVKGETGVLSIDDNCVINRELSWTEHEAL